jgi:conjugative transfer pilus assembly protein TraH
MKRVLWVVAALFASASAHAGWVDDWFQQHTRGGAGSFETQSRGYYTAGTFEGRWRLQNDSPLTFSPPKLKVGCGGIDLFLGGMSFLNAKYLVQKAERILQAAPAFAFDMALNEYCKECKAIKDFMEHAADVLNSVQVNDCRLSKRLGQTIAEDTVGGEHKNIMEEMWAEAAGGQSVGQGLQDSWTGFVNASSNGTIPDDVKPLTSDCPDAFQQVFMNGSVVQNVTGMLGLAGYDDIMRGLLGDVFVHPSADGNAYQTDVIQPCPGNDTLDPTDFMTGDAQKKSVANVCSPDSANGALTIVHNHLVSIVTAMRTRTALSPADQEFIDSSPVPIRNALRDAVRAGIADQEIQVLEGPLAIEFAERVFDDLYKATRLVLRKAKEVSDTQTAAKADQRKCDTTFLSGAMDQIRSMAENATKYRSMAHIAYNRMEDELAGNILQANQMREANARDLNQQHAPWVRR